MKTYDANQVYSRILNEGFDYCFICYSTFNEIKDKKFHELREKYVKAHDELEIYIKEHTDGEFDE